MKKYINPYLIILLLLVVLSGGIFYMTKKYSLVQNTNSASIFATGQIRNSIATPLDTGPSYNIQLMNGTCVVIVTDSNGYPTSSSYIGHFNASYDCVRIMVHPTTPLTPTSNVARTTKLIWDSALTTCKEYKWLNPNWIFSKNRLDLNFESCKNNSVSLQAPKPLNQ